MVMKTKFWLGWLLSRGCVFFRTRASSTRGIAQSIQKWKSGIKKQPVGVVWLFWRGGRDSNPRWSLKPHNHLAGDPVQPLRHLPEYSIIVLQKDLAEGEGFEPTLAFTKPVFKTGALNRSATLPFLTQGGVILS